MIIFMIYSSISERGGLRLFQIRAAPSGVVESLCGFSHPQFLLVHTMEYNLSPYLQTSALFPQKGHGFSFIIRPVP